MPAWSTAGCVESVVVVSGPAVDGPVPARSTAGPNACVVDGRVCGERGCCEWPRGRRPSACAVDGRAQCLRGRRQGVWRAWLLSTVRPLGGLESLSSELGRVEEIECRDRPNARDDPPSR